MTFQGLDMEGRVTNWGRVKALGYAYSISRLVGEQGAVDPDYAANTAGAIGVGIVPGGYHFIAHGTAAEHCKVFVNAMGDPHGKIVMLDVENPNAHPKPTESDVGAWFNEYRKHVPLHPVVVYSRENYWFGIGDPKLGPNVVLMTSRYPGGSTYPGDGAYAWTERWGGLSPRFWQWKGSSAIGVGASVDFSAFKGTLAELQAIAGSTPPAPDTSTGAPDMPPLPVSPTSAPKLVSVTAPVTFYNLDGTVKSTGHSKIVDMPSYIELLWGGAHLRVISAGEADGTPSLVCVHADAIAPFPSPAATDCTAAVAAAVAAVQHQLDTTNARIHTAVTALGGTI